MNSKRIYLSNLMEAFKASDPKPCLTPELIKELAFSSLETDEDDIILLCKGDNQGGWAEYLTSDGLITTSQAEPSYTEEAKIIASTLDDHFDNLPPEVKELARTYIHENWNSVFCAREPYTAKVQV